MYIGVHVKDSLLLADFIMNLEFSPQSFEKYSNIKLNENPSGGSRNVPCGEKDGQT
jgi:hypothetical protein